MKTIMVEWVDQYGNESVLEHKGARYEINHGRCLHVMAADWAPIATYAPDVWRRVWEVTDAV